MSIGTSIGKTTRKIRKAATGEEPQADILETLKEEHEEVRVMLKKLVASNRAAERKSLLVRIRVALIPHLRAEEKVVYDAVKALGAKNAKQDGHEGYIEHHLADEMLAKLAAIRNAMSPEFGAAAKVLKELVDHHVREEESNVWSDIREHFSDEERHVMNRKFEAAKNSIRIPH